jgi:Ca2+-binding EF-hand superfamily protein
MTHELADRFAAATKRYEVNRNEVFYEFDPRRTGFLTPLAFNRALVSAHVHFTDADLQRLHSAYLEDGRINYRRFLQDAASPPPDPAGQRSNPDASLLHDFGLNLRSRGLTIADVIAPYDRFHSGRVSVSIFQRSFGFAPNAQRIADQYTIEATTDVDCVRLQRDVDNATEIPNDGKQLGTPLPPFFDNFVRCIVARGLNFREAFDRYPRGSIPLQSFLSVVTSWGIGLTPSQLRELANPFTVSGGVEHQLFIRAIVEAIEKTDLQPAIPDTSQTDFLDQVRSQVASGKSALRQQLELAEDEARGRLPRAQFYKVVRLCGFRPSANDIQAIDEEFLCRDDVIDVHGFLAKVDPIVAPQVDLDDVLARLRNHLQSRRLLISDFFRWLDRDKSGLASVPQLVSAFQSIDFHPTTNELNAVTQKFGNGRVIRWPDLIDVVEPKLPDRSPVKASPRQRPEILRRISRAVFQYDVNLREEFVKLDARRTGLVSTRAFKGVLDSVPVRVSMNEIFVSLSEYFTADKDMLNYHEFCDDVGGFEAAPPSPIRSAGADQSLRKLKAALVYRRIAVEELFVGHDSARTGMVANEVVGPCCRPIAAFVSVETIRQIATEFRDRRQPEKFNYRRLAAALSDIVTTEEDLSAATDAGRQAAGDEDAVITIMNVIRSRLADRRKTAYELFSNVPGGLISVLEFRNRLAGAGFPLREAGFQALARRYKAGRGGEVSWDLFCADVAAFQPMPS